MAHKTNVSQEVTDMAAIAKAMSHPVRIYILQTLSKLDACCYSGNLAEELGINRSALSLHLKELKYAGLIQGETEPPYIKYCINKENWAKAKELYSSLFNL